MYMGIDRLDSCPCKAVPWCYIGKGAGKLTTESSGSIQKSMIPRSICTVKLREERLLFKQQIATIRYYPLTAHLPRGSRD
jgi:hypothetical protein